MKRRGFLKFIAGAVAACPLATRAQQPSIPLVGFLGTTIPEDYPTSLQGFHRGLSEAGFVDGQNVKVEYRWAKGRYAELPALAAELVNRKVAIIMRPPAATCSR